MTCAERILFLDIDGVLVTARTLKERRGRDHVADDACVRELNRVIAETGARLVLSSSWRFCGLREMNRILNLWGVAEPLLDMTPDLTRQAGAEGLYAGVPRGREIQAWLDDNPRAVRFAVVDDDADMEHLVDRLVRTNFKLGLTSEAADRLIAMLREGAES